MYINIASLIITQWINKQHESQCTNEKDKGPSKCTCTETKMRNLRSSKIVKDENMKKRSSTIACHSINL